MTKRIYILYDSRAAGDQGTEEAQVCVVCEDNQDARREAEGGSYGGVACYSYRDNGPDKPLDDQRFEWDWFPSSKKKRRRRRRGRNRKHVQSED